MMTGSYLDGIPKLVERTVFFSKNIHIFFSIDHRFSMRMRLGEQCVHFIRLSSLMPIFFNQSLVYIAAWIFKFSEVLETASSAKDKNACQGRHSTTMLLFLPVFNAKWPYERVSMFARHSSVNIIFKMSTFMYFLAHSILFVLCLWLRGGFLQLSLCCHIHITVCNE